MFLNLLLLYFFIIHLYPSTSSICSEDEKYNSKKAAQMCFNKQLSKLDVRESCEWFDFVISECDKELEKYYDQEFKIENKTWYYIWDSNLLTYYNVGAKLKICIVSIIMYSFLHNPIHIANPRPG